jgi:glutaminyl-peptide cyclotransferase
MVFLLPVSVLGRSPYEHLVDFCKIGTRVPGSEGHRQARDYIIASLEKPVIDSFFTYDTWFYNIYRRFGDGDTKIAIAAHWDSDIDCPGANDGGSGVSLLLGLADTMMFDAPPITVDLIFFDGEDVNKAELFGSKYFAAKCTEDYSFIIVLDMVGDKDLTIYQEGNSRKFFPQLVDSLWEIGSAVAPAVFIPQVKYYIVDDHISLIKYGFRAVDIIDFDYPYWDTRFDTIDKCSKESLVKMFEYLLHIVYPQYIR